MIISLKCPFHTFMLGAGVAITAQILLNKYRSKSLSYQHIIDRYSLLPHPEGGYYAETFRSDSSVVSQRGSDSVARAASTGIYFLICPGNISRLHRIKSDEMWHFYLGGPMTVIELDANEKDGYRSTVLGQDLQAGEVVQYVVKAGVWFGSFPNQNSSYSFVGCTVAPGFDFCDFELGSRSALIKEYPAALAVIHRLTEGLP